MPKFIVIDGLDGSGKGTQIALLQKHFAGRPIAFTREPGGTPRAERIREILLAPSAQQADPYTDLLLFFAARKDHIVHLIEPMLSEGLHVISDRYDSSSFAFQIFGERHAEHMDTFDRLRDRIVIGDKGDKRRSPGLPHAYLFLDLPARVAYERCRAVAEEKQSVFDLKPLEYHQRVRDGFRAFAAQYGTDRTQMVTIDADRSVEAVQDELLGIIEGLFEADDNRDE